MAEPENAEPEETLSAAVASKIFESRLEELRLLEQHVSEVGKLIWQTIGGLLIVVAALIPYTADIVGPGDAVILLYAIPVLCAVAGFEWFLWLRLAELAMQRAHMRAALILLTKRLGTPNDIKPFFVESGVLGDQQKTGSTGVWTAAIPVVGLIPLFIFFRLENHPDTLQIMLAVAIDPILIALTVAAILKAWLEKRRLMRTEFASDSCPVSRK